MKSIKCILAVILGTVLGLLPSCESRPKPPDQPPQPGEKQTKKSTEKGQKAEPPKKEEELPLPVPIYE